MSEMNLDYNRMGHKQKESPLNINEFLNSVYKYWNGELEENNFREAVKDLVIKLKREDINSEKYYLAAYSLRKYFSNYLNDEEINFIPEINDLTKNVLISRIDSRVNIMEQEVNAYFAQRNSPFDYFKLSLIEDDELANSILILSSKYMSRTTQDMFRKDSNLVLESFIDERDGRPGVWMSYKGIHLDLSKITND